MGFLSNPYFLDDVLKFLNAEDLDNMMKVSSRTRNAVNRMKDRPKKCSMKLLYITNDVVESYEPLWSLKQSECKGVPSLSFPLKALKMAPKLDCAETIVLDGLRIKGRDAEELSKVLRSQTKAQTIFFTPRNRRREKVPEFTLLDHLKPKVIIVKNFLEEESHVKECLENLKKQVNDVKVARFEKYYTWSHMIKNELLYAYWYYKNPDPFTVHVRLWKPF
ncbi:unnamed protein product [Bursaphelenchus xylophilus]|uniref:(pine wood nematode) hypothetical protein n=1 Tax=Bursaphelenchus xylophilus TaxID=6326 RepID=A0A1I7SWK5_BURXY|nr:unnamed protein product [Bursaphelenchus xylophilus]CAG9099582.1 unnamed protein product [Bursaphelenchus xylophilus]